MADSLSGSLSSSISWSLVETTPLGTQIPDNGLASFSWPVTDGTAALKADLRWYVKKSLAASATDTHDLTNLSLTLFGTATTTNFARIRAIYLVHGGGGASDILQLGNAGSNAWKGFIAGTSPYLLVPPGGHVLLADPNGSWDAVSGSAKNLRINNQGSGSVEYTLVILGTSA